MTDIATLISSVGFPIVSFLICAYGLKYSYDRSIESNDKALDKIGTLADAVNHNTEVLISLSEKIGGV